MERMMQNPIVSSSRSHAMPSVRGWLLWPLVLVTLAVSMGCQSTASTVVGKGQQREEAYQPGAFSRISIGIPAQVELVEGEQHEIRIHTYGNLLEVIEVKRSGDRVTISTRPNLRSSDPIRVTVVAPALSHVSVAGNARVWGALALTGEKTGVSIAGSGKMELPVAAEAIDVSISGSGNVTLTGEVKSLNLRISGSGTIEAETIAAKDVDVRISGSGTVRVQADDSLNVRIAGSGRVYYSGNALTDTSISGSGRVNRVEF